MNNNLKEKTFTLEQIKNAFWETFHKTDKIFFDYLRSEKSNQESTEEGWDDFLENLTKNKKE